jgi:Peroxidase, family 2
MLFTAIFVPILTVAAYPQAELRARMSAGDWIAPDASDDRAPCPGLNTLANHGYLNRNGRDITDQNIKDAFLHVYGIDNGASQTLIDGVPSAKNPDGTLNLNSLRVHNTVGRTI